MALRILLTNDDGIDAPGLAALQASVDVAVRSLGVAAHVVTVAPDRGRSECGHSVTNGAPLTLSLVRPNCYSLNGTPVDCVRVATNTVIRDADVVVSGVNAGANLGIDLLVSGTFAAAREAASQGISALAMSHYRRPGVAKTWDHVPHWALQTLVEFIKSKRSSNASLWNLNFPAIDISKANTSSAKPERVICEVDQNAVPRKAVSGSGTCSSAKPWESSRPVADQVNVAFELDFHGRPRDPGSDVDHCFQGRMTLSKLEFAVT